MRTWLAGWAALTAGALLCAVGWYGVSGERFAERQIPYLASCTVPGAALLVAGALLLTAPGPGREARELHGLWAGRLRGGADGSTDGRSTPIDVRPTLPSSEDPPLSVPGGRLAHRPDCPLLDGKETEPAASAAEPCPVCEPGGAPTAGG
ncbi:hypothetical protein [Streptomyces sp. ODS28]|uniref:hypothetical protein n=1 Tax=Streptomyces sp. ODS28 TaxID=3136688 RepID=UPI0031E7C51C